MEKFVNILAEINKTREAIKTATTKENELIEQDLQIALKILQNNAKIALFNEVMPVALEVLSKYNSKPYGTKTKQKISDEIKEKTNCRFYISSHYTLDSFDIYPSDTSNEYSISCGTGRQKRILIDNKIQPVKFEEVRLYYINSEYVTDIPQRIETLKSLYKDAVAKQEELKAICDNFNKLAVGINHLYYNKHIFYYNKHIYKNMEI